MEARQGGATTDRRLAERRLRRQLWTVFRVRREALDELKGPIEVANWVGSIEQWVDRVHHEVEGTDVDARVQHVMRCLLVYTRLVTRPMERKRGEEARELRRRRHAKWLVCAALVRIYKQQRQEAELRCRAAGRVGLVCASTRNVGTVG